MISKSNSDQNIANNNKKVVLMCFFFSQLSQLCNLVEYEVMYLYFKEIVVLIDLSS